MSTVIIQVSIRASLQQRGEPRKDKQIESHTFQSAPHFSSEANDFTYGYGAGESYVSIRASLQQRGEPHDGTASAWRTRCFNPRLTSAARRTYYSIPRRNRPGVSIRASLQQRGELR